MIIAWLTLHLETYQVRTKKWVLCWKKNRVFNYIGVYIVVVLVFSFFGLVFL
jgi:hypothetical protein